MLDQLQRFMKRVRSAARPAAPATVSKGLLGQYVVSAPSPQNALDIFASEWSCELPDPNLVAGLVKTFDDYRIDWFMEQLGGIRDKTVLELGPLEAGHTYMLERLGATSILSIEGNTRAYLKCLIVKEIFDLKRARFLCGDFLEYLRANRQRFDVCLASGVLYHMTNPVELIALLARTTDHVCLWTHYCDPNAGHWPTGQASEYAGFSHMLYKMAYGPERNWGIFCGGPEAYRSWMTRDDIINAFRHFGLTEITLGVEEPDHQNGPAFSLVASRPGEAG
jgi:hypothetical protein